MSIWQFQEFRISMQRFIQQILLTLLNFTFTKRFVAFDTDKVDLVKRSEFFLKADKDVFLFALNGQTQIDFGTREKVS